MHSFTIPTMIDSISPRYLWGRRIRQLQTAFLLRTRIIESYHIVDRLTRIQFEFHRLKINVCTWLETELNETQQVHFYYLIDNYIGPMTNYIQFKIPNFVFSDSILRRAQNPARWNGFNDSQAWNVFFYGVFY